MPLRYHLACAIDNNDFSSGEPSVNEPEIKILKSFETVGRAKSESQPAIDAYNKRNGDESRVSGCILFEGAVVEKF